MSNRKDTGILQRGANIAQTISGAVKAGRAIAGIAKGASVGGPYGAIIGAVWTNRQTIGKILLAVDKYNSLDIYFQKGF